MTAMICDDYHAWFAAGAADATERRGAGGLSSYETRRAEPITCVDRVDERMNTLAGLAGVPVTIGPRVRGRLLRTPVL